MPTCSMSDHLNVVKVGIHQVECPAWILRPRLWMGLVAEDGTAASPTNSVYAVY